MKQFTYKGRKVFKPENISSRLVKQLIDEGGDYGLTVQQIIEIISSRFIANKKANAVSHANT